MTRVSSPRLCLAILAALAASACGAKDVPIIPGPDPVEDVLVWVADARGEQTTLWIRGNSTGGRLLASRPGILLSLPTGLVEVREREIALPTCDCAAEPGDGGTEECPAIVEGGATGTVLVEALLPGGEELAVTEPPDATDDDVPLYEALEFGATVTASIGPFLFIRDDTRSLACGAAHEGWSSQFEVFDVAAGETTELLSEEERAQVVGREQTTAFKLFAGDTLVDAARPEDLELTMISPIVLPGAGVGLRYQFTARSSFAASDGTWGAYTRSVDVPAASLPAALVPFSLVPRALRRFPLPRPELAVGGFARVTPTGEQLAELGRLFSLTPEEE
jgi:hypothetical protein